MTKVLLLTGAGGAGKSTVAELIAKRDGYVYLDGDREDTEFFPEGKQWLPENVEKLQMAQLPALEYYSVRDFIELIVVGVVCENIISIRKNLIFRSKVLIEE